MAIPTQPAEEQLLKQAAGGDKRAFGLLYERYLDEIFRFLFYRLGDRAEAEDMTEATFLKAWEKLPPPGTDQPIRNFRAWVYRIARNLVIDRYRTRKETEQLESLNGIQDHDPPIETMIEQHEEALKLSAALQELDPQQQQVIILRFINGLSHAEAAEVMGLKEGHLRVLQHRGLNNLRTWLKNRHGVEDGKRA